jgi:regulator of cell morphogenesis and NO signaling
MTVTSERRIGEIVAEDPRAAAVFRRFGIDFCCGGAKTLAQACAAAGVTEADVVQDLEEGTSAPIDGAPRFAEWDLDFLCDYIVQNHHRYVRQAIAELPPLVTKVAEVHGPRHPELRDVARLFAFVVEELQAHMMKEEQVLFPIVQQLARAERIGQPVPAPPFGSIAFPIQMMEMEHASAGDALAEARRLTGGYALPADGCATLAAVYRGLDAFEADLHQHVHLENNILFPKALALEGRIVT